MWQEQKERCDMVDVGIKKVLAEKKIPPGNTSYNFEREGTGRAK